MEGVEVSRLMEVVVLPSNTSSSASRTSELMSFLKGGGEMGERMRAYDWSTSPLGFPETWSQPLRTLVAVMLGSQQPMFVAWGPERIMLYNNGYAPMCGKRHPAALCGTRPVRWPACSAPVPRPPSR
ncbi:MAG: histidine kinase [Microvirga sp.]|nr:histidine kinase [Microvirga sp.]